MREPRIDVGLPSATSLHGPAQQLATLAIAGTHAKKAHVHDGTRQPVQSDRPPTRGQQRPSTKRDTAKTHSAMATPSKTTTRGALAGRPSFGRLPRDRYYHHYVPASNGMRRPGFAAEKPYRLPAQPSFLTKENLRLRQYQ